MALVLDIIYQVEPIFDVLLWILRTLQFDLFISVVKISSNGQIKNQVQYSAIKT